MVSNDCDSADRPLIGITTYLERARFGGWDLDAALLPRTYLDTVIRSGGTPVLLPPLGVNAGGILARVDGLVLAGGADLDPASYQQDTNPATTGIQPDRDAFEFAVVDTALAIDLPLLGVCRGMQVLNVALGGTLVQHLPERTGHEGHRPIPGTFGSRSVTTRPNSVLANIFGEHAEVRCHHHQAIDELADKLEAVAWDADGTVEAVELAGRRFTVGVQWHPEETAADDRLFATLVAAAHEHRLG